MVATAVWFQPASGARTSASGAPASAEQRRTASASARGASGSATRGGQRSVNGNAIHLEPRRGTLTSMSGTPPRTSPPRPTTIRTNAPKPYVSRSVVSHDEEWNGRASGCAAAKPAHRRSEGSTSVGIAGSAASDGVTVREPPSQDGNEHGHLEQSGDGVVEGEDRALSGPAQRREVRTE